MKKDLKNNIKFNYLYRDAGNYKKYGFVVFKNPKKLSIDEASKKICENLITQLYFEPKSVTIPALFFEKYDPELDHSWNEFESTEATKMSATDNRTITQFIQGLIATKIAEVKYTL